MTKVSNTLYVVQDPKGNVLNGTSSFDRTECKRKFLDFMEGKDSCNVFIDAAFERYTNTEGFNLLSINLPQELSKFED